MKQKSNIKEFSWQEACSDETGKTSGSATSGILAVIIGLICFIYCVFTSHLELGIQSVTVVGIGSSLLGVNKWMNNRLADDKVEDVITES